MRRFVLAGLAATMVIGCAGHDFSGRSVHQGNLSVNPQTVKRLKLGMTKQEVTQVMGSSVIAPMFRQDRWDYSRTFQQPNQPVEVNALSLYFEHDRLSRIDYKPAG